MVAPLLYLGKTLMATDNNWPAASGNIWKARQT